MTVTTKSCSVMCKVKYLHMNQVKPYSFTNKVPFISLFWLKIDDFIQFRKTFDSERINIATERSEML